MHPPINKHTQLKLVAALSISNFSCDVSFSSSVLTAKIEFWNLTSREIDALNR